ncbi:hypothetical protein NFI96_015451 [Prochilodus magdalenae]|nr:hypothetical protein NFI96_015451 [Prochilodus magdalenae]
MVDMVTKVPQKVLCFKKPVKPKPAQAATVQKAQTAKKVQLPEALQTKVAGYEYSEKALTSMSLHFNKVKEDIHVGFNKLIAKLNKKGAPYALSLANRLYGEKTYQFVEKFLGDTKIFYNAELETVDFKSNARAARVNINTWVEKQTQEKIKDLLKEGDVDESTRLVLVNAIYFKGKWEKQFRSTMTTKVPFNLNKKDTKPVQMMNLTAEFPLAYIPEMNCQILEMPYTGKELRMLIALRNGIDDGTTGLEKVKYKVTLNVRNDLEQNLTYETSWSGHALLRWIM